MEYQQYVTDIIPYICCKKTKTCELLKILIIDEKIQEIFSINTGNRTRITDSLKQYAKSRIEDSVFKIKNNYVRNCLKGYTLSKITECFPINIYNDEDKVLLLQYIKEKHMQYLSQITNYNNKEDNDVLEQFILQKVYQYLFQNYDHEDKLVKYAKYKVEKFLLMSKDDKMQSIIKENVKEKINECITEIMNNKYDKDALLQYSFLQIEKFKRDDDVKDTLKDLAKKEIDVFLSKQQQEY